jgi:Lamin Tail Domain
MHRIRLLAPLLLVLGLLLAAPLAQSASSNVVVSQVFAGGGNSGAAYTNDFVELLNRGSTTIDLSAWTIQYASASSTSWQASALTGSIQPGRYYLVELASGGTAGSPLPTADATGSTNLAVSGGKVALVRGSTALTCGATAGSCAASPLVEDLVGYGSATDYEGSGPAPALSGTTAAVRGSGGCADTDSNSADFTAAAPAPRNSSSTAATCGGSAPPANLTQAAAVDVQVQAVISIALERSSISFGNAGVGDTPAPISERVTVVSNNATGYALSVHRSAFAPADLPLAIAVAAGALLPIPVQPAADLLLGSASAPSAPAGDVWATNIGFASPLPVVAPGRYTATVTYTVIGR